VALLEAPENAQSHVIFLAICADTSPLSMCGTNTTVRSLGGRGTSREQRIFAVAVLVLQYFPSLTFSLKTQISEKAVKLASRELNGFIVSKCFMAPDSVKICQVLQTG
jgi:hypothetical protein